MTKEGTMSKSCEQCRRRVRSEGGMTTVILRKDPATGYTCRFCSEECAAAWTGEHAALGSVALLAGLPPVESSVPSDPAASAGAP